MDVLYKCLKKGLSLDEEYLNQSNGPESLLKRMT